MKNRKAINKEVDRTMHSLDSIKKVGTDAYFYARLEARLDDEASGTLLQSLWAEPRYILASAAIALIVLFNLFSVAEYQQYFQAQNLQETEEVARLAEAYEMNMPVLYDTNEDNNGN